MLRILAIAALTLGLSSAFTNTAEAGGRWYGRYGGQHVQHNSHWGGHVRTMFTRATTCPATHRGRTARGGITPATSTTTAQACSRTVTISTMFPGTMMCITRGTGIGNRG